MFFTRFRYEVRGGGVSQGIGTQPATDLLMQFFTPDSSKIEVFGTYVFDTVIT